METFEIKCLKCKAVDKGRINVSYKDKIIKFEIECKKCGNIESIYKSKK